MVYRFKKHSIFEGKQKGSVLVLVLIVISSLIILSVGLAYRTKIELKLAQNNARRTQAYYLALGGIERVKALFSQGEFTPQTIGQICQFIGSAEEEKLFEQFSDFDSDEKTTLTYSLHDELAYLNINTSDPAIWLNLAYISEESCATILDWIDEDDNANPDGAETDFYERLDTPYIAKDRPCIAIKELKFLREVTQVGYMGEDLNRNFYLDENESDGEIKFPPDNEDGILDLGLIDTFTTYGEAKLNINTVSYNILHALPGLDENAPEQILTYRAGSDGRPGTEDDMFCESVDDLVNIEGLTELDIELLGQYCCFESEYFRMFSSSEVAGQFECGLMVTVTYADSQLQVLSLEMLY